MFRLVKYLKPFIAIILIAIALLFIQALCDLALPDYMSNIVNNGIQQSGIINAVPEAIRQSRMDKLTIFMDEADKSEVLSNYTLIDGNSPDYSRYLKIYPALEKEAVYKLNKIDKNEEAKINPVLGKAFIAVSVVEQLIKDPQAAASAGMEIGFDLSKLPADISTEQVFAVLSDLPSETRLKMLAKLDEKFAVLGDSMINQTAISEVKKEYAELGMDVGSIQNRYIWRTGFFMLLLSLLSAASTIGVGYFSARTAAGLSRNLRKKVFDKVSGFSNTEFDKFSTASLITRSTNDITQIQMLVIMLIRMVFFAPILGIGGTIRALNKSVSMSWIIALAVIILIGIVILIFSIAMPKFKKIQGLVDRLNLVTRENLSGMMVIRAFNMQKFEEDRFDKANTELTDTSLFINRLMVVMMPIMMLLMNGLGLLIIWVGAHQVQQFAMQVGDIMAFMQYAMIIVSSFLMLSMMFIMLPRASVSAARVADVLETKTVINDPENPKQFSKESSGEVKFKNVSFRYPGAEADVLHNINFNAKPGQITAIIGSTGSGKSTLVNLIPRFYDVTQGSIFIDEIDIRNVTQHDLREKIGYIPQKSMLFSGTIESNLLYANENASQEQLEKAVEAAQVLDFIKEKPEGFKSMISQKGSNISGGQNQRLSIARALVKRPDIYIFDDCFSALDFKTDAALRRALKSYASGSTVIIVAQRIGTVMNADQILVIDSGIITGKGKHKELMESCEIYRDIALSQFSREELA